MPSTRIHIAIHIAAFLLPGSVALAAEPGTEGGTGDTFPYIIRVEDQGTHFHAQKDYFSIDAVSWFVNKQGNWRRSELATGQVKIKAAGAEFSFPLGSYLLDKGAYTAPIFNLPLLPTTPFDGAPITISASIMGMKRNTPLGAALQDIANMAVSYGTIALGTMSLTAYPGLPEVASSATKLSKDLVAKMGDRQVPIFDESSGIGNTLLPKDLRGDEFYLLLHRGRRLKESHLSIDTNRIDVLEDGKRLTEGAWVLFRIRKEPVYSGARPWTAAGRQALNQLELEMRSFSNNVRSGAALLQSLQSTPQGAGSNLGDRFVFISNLIQADQALTSAQAMREAIKMNTYLDLAKKAVGETNAGIFFSGIAALNGSPAPELVVNAVRDSLEAQAKTVPPRTNVARISLGQDILGEIVSMEAEKTLQLERQQRGILNQFRLQLDPKFRVTPGEDDSTRIGDLRHKLNANPLVDELQRFPQMFDLLGVGTKA